jgi:hypothetical protein
LQPHAAALLAHRLGSSSRITVTRSAGIGPPTGTKEAGRESRLPIPKGMKLDGDGYQRDSAGVAWERRGKGGESWGRVKVAMFRGFPDQITPRIALEQSKNLHAGQKTNQLRSTID